MGTQLRPHIFVAFGEKSFKICFQNLSKCFTKNILFDFLKDFV